MVKLKNLSVSTIDAFELCPRRAYLSKNDNSPDKAESSATALGKAVHEALEIYHTEGLGEFDSLEAMFDEIAKTYLITDSSRFIGMRELVAQYGATNAADTPTIGVEYKFTLNVGSLPFKGVIDRVDYLGNGVYKIVDYKTSVFKKDRRELENDLQLISYDIALRELWEEGALPGLPKPERVICELYYLRFGPVEQEYDQTKRDSVYAYIKVMGDVILNMEEALPKANQYCPYCDYKVNCPLVLSDFAAYTGADSPLTIEERAERLKDLRNIRKTISKEIDSLQGALVEELIKGSPNGEYVTDSIAVRVSSRKNTSFDQTTLKSNLPDWSKYGIVDVKKLTGEGSDEELKVLNDSARVFESAPFIKVYRGR